MKNSIYLFLILLIVGCSKELHMTSDHNKVISFDRTSMEEELGVYSNYFVADKTDADVVLEFNDGIHKNNTFSIGVYLWKKYKNSNLESGTLSIGNMQFNLRHENGLPTFVPEGAEKLLFAGSSKWLESMPNPANYINQKKEISLSLNGSDLITLDKKFPPILEMATIGEPHPSFEFYKVVDRNNVHLTWNKDVDNTNGVLLMMRFTGQQAHNVLGSPVPGIFRFIIVDDDGQETLPAELFESIPENAMIEFEVWRGDLDRHTMNDGGTINIHIVSKGFVSIILEN